MDESIQEALEDATDDPPAEVLTADIDVLAMPSLAEQLDEAGAGHDFVTVKIADVDHEETGHGATVYAASGDGILVDFEDGPRAMFRLRDLLATAAEAVTESEFDPTEGAGEDEE